MRVIESTKPTINQDRQKLIKTVTKVIDVVHIEWSVEPLPVTADMVRAECKRRMILLFGARDADDLDNKISNGSMESNHLLQKENDDPGSWDPLTDGVRKAAMMAAYDGMVALRAASNVLEASLVSDYEDDIHWP